MNYITLNTGVKMPILGLGTWKSAPNKVSAAVECAILECNYRHIDCASIYKNEAEVGEAFDKIFTGKKISRDEIFVTSKLWNDAHDAENVEDACKKTLHDLRLDYLDLYLMHWGIATPNNLGNEPLNKDGVLITKNVPVRETWEAMEKLVANGLVKAVGVANFTGPMLVDLLTYAKIKPVMNQIELHPYNQQTKLIDFCNYQNIAVTAYSPLGSPGNTKARVGQPILLEDAKVIEIANKHKKSPAQVLIRWAIQRNTVVIPKSVTPENIKNNFEVFDFELSKDEMEILGGLDRGHRFVDPWKWWKVPYFN